MENKATINRDNTVGFSGGHALLWLLLVAFIVYIPTFFYGLTELDDYKLIVQSDGFNSDWHSLVSAFHRGVFEISGSHYFRYYRPVFLDSIIVNYQLCGKAPLGYHIANVAFHMAAVALLYELYRKLEVKDLYAFILCLLFAVHPVLVQAVAWIPGRNDTLLAIFTFSFFLCSINYTNTAAKKQLVFSALFLLLALFTKETAVIVPIVAFVLIVFVLRKKGSGVVMVKQYAVWTGCIMILALMRSTAYMRHIRVAPKVIASDLLRRIPVVIEYLGKIFFPYNLSVFPSMAPGTYIYGILAMVLVLFLAYRAKKGQQRFIFSGIGLFILFLAPVFFLPHGESRQAFEHRLYLPLTGILLILPQTPLFNNRLTERQLLGGFIGVACILTVINLYHQRNFANPLAFWSQVAATDSTSAHACMICGVWEKDPAISYNMFSKAYQINPREKFLNFCRGVKLQNEDSVIASAPYLLEEKKRSGYYECDYYLARVAVKKNDLAGAVALLQSYISRNPDNAAHVRNRLIDDRAWLQQATASERAMHTVHPEMALWILKGLGLYQ